MNRAKTAVIMLLTLTLCGCGPYMPWHRPNTVFETEKVLYKDYTVKRYLRLTKHDATRLPSGSLSVKIVFTNVKNSDLWCDVVVNFLDADGIVTEEGYWQPTLFERNGQKTVSAKSIGPKAADYRILLRKQE